MSEKDEQRAAIRSRYRQEDNSISVIPAQVMSDILSDKNRRVRVGIYSRVSTDNLEQVSSITLQEDTFEKLVNDKENWDLVETYTDEGISGTSVGKRAGFRKMIEDAQSGKLDLIVTKSVSRFARNIQDSIKYYRYLRSLPKPVYVWFVTDNLNTQNPGSEMLLNFLSMIAEGESRNKSEIMNWSIDSRFKKGLFLTPKLLGYDVVKEEGTERPLLVINEEEAQTVRNCFGMLLNGYSTKQIADVLNVLQRKTKLGNTHWTSSTVLALLKNERYCGDVLARKTWTPDFLDHKSKKNRKNKNQYYKEDHHEAIVSREVFRLAQKIIASHRYSMHGIIPSLSVVMEGVLKGCVSVNRSWAGVSIEDYIEACEYAYTENAEEEKTVKYGDISRFDFRGYETVTSHFFSMRDTPFCTVSNDRLKFSVQCIRQFADVEYVELLFNPKEFIFVIRPCDKDNVNAIEWCSFVEDGRIIAKDRGCKAFSTMLFEYMGWNPKHRYRFCGVRRMLDGERILFFDLKKPQVLIVDEDCVMEGKRRHRISYFPQQYIEHYGDDFYKAIYDTRTYLIDYYKMWNAYADGVPIKDQSELIAYARELMMGCGLEAV